MSNVSLIDGHVDEGVRVIPDIHKIIDDAMEKRDRTVTIFITDSTTSISVSPLESGRPAWIYHEGIPGIQFNKYSCPECGNRNTYPTPYCPTCGEALSAPVYKENP